MDGMIALIFYKLVRAAQAQTKFHLKFFCIFLAFMTLAEDPDWEVDLSSE